MKDTTLNITDSTTLPAYKSFQRTSTPTKQMKPGKETLNDPQYSAFLRHLHNVPRKMKTRGLLREIPDIISCHLLVRKEKSGDSKESVRTELAKQSVHIESNGELKETFQAGSEKIAHIESKELHEVGSLRRTSKAQHILDFLRSFDCGKKLKTEGKSVQTKTKRTGLEADFQIREGGEVSYYATGCLCIVIE